MLAYLFVVLAIGVRFLPHAWHFTPVGASLLFFGAKHSRRHMWIPVALFAASDVVLTRFVYHYPLTWETFASSAWYVSAILIGGLLKQKADVPRVAGASLASSVAFFVISNFAVWAGWNMYSKDLSGLVACYAAAIPFFRNAMVADMVYAMAFFAAPLVIVAMERRMYQHAVTAKH